MTAPLTLRKKPQTYNQDSSEFQEFSTPEKKQSPQLLSLKKKEKPKSFTGYEGADEALRTGLQIPQALAEVTTPGLMAGLWQMLAQGEVLDPEEIEHIKAISEREGIPFDEEAYMQAAQNALGTVPTVSNIARGIESKTGIPLEPKEGYQKGLRFVTGLGKLQPGTLGQKAIGAGAGLATKEGLEYVGVPEPLAEMAAYGVGGYAGSKAPKIDVNFGKKKPSGMPERGFERLKETTEVPQRKIQQISDKLEKDFKGVSDKIIKESPIGETAENLKNDPIFKRESKELLDQAQIIADKTPGAVPSVDYKKALIQQASKQGKGFALGEYEKSYIKYMTEAADSVAPKNITFGQLVEQYRKNNRSLGEYFEPGASKALNRAKKDALLDQNRAVASVLEQSHPELSKVFKEGNDRWTKIMDAETIDNFVSDMFPEGKKIDFKHMKEIFDDPNYQRIFNRSLGKEGTKAFEQAIEDMLTAEKPYKMMREAKEKGMKDAFITAKAYLINPKLAAAKGLYDATKGAYRMLFNATLDKPRIGFNFTRGVNKLKKGDFKAAEKEFTKVAKDVELLEAPKKAEAAKAQSEPIEIKVEPIRETKAEKPQEMKLIGEKPNEPVKSNGETFTTEKGSTYTVNKDGTTTRNKAYRPEHGEKEVGQQPKSERTYYITPDDAKRLGEFQTSGPGKKIVELHKGSLGVMYIEGPNKGKVESRTLVNSEMAPKEGLIPLEIWKGGEKAHFGNKIKEIKKPKEKRPEGKSESKEFKIKTEKDTERSRFSRNKTIEDEKGNFAGELAYDVEPNVVYLADIRVEKEFQRQGLAKKLLKEVFEEYPDKDFDVSSLKPDGAKLFSKLLERELKPSLTANDLEIPGASQEPIRLSKKDILTVRKNLGIQEIKLKPKRTAPKVQEIKRQDISKTGLKNQKEFILSKLDDAINNPKKYEGQTKIELNVPGDGEFKIHNNKKALEQFYKNVSKEWPDKPLKDFPEPDKRKKLPTYSKEHWKETEIKQNLERENYLKEMKKQNANEFHSDKYYSDMIKSYEAGEFKEQAKQLKKEWKLKKENDADLRKKGEAEMLDKKIEVNLRDAKRLEEEAQKHIKEGRTALAKRKLKKAKDIREFQKKLKESK